MLFYDEKVISKREWAKRSNPPYMTLFPAMKIIFDLFLALCHTE